MFVIVVGVELFGKSGGFCWSGGGWVFGVKFGIFEGCLRVVFMIYFWMNLFYLGYVIF